MGNLFLAQSKDMPFPKGESCSGTLRFLLSVQWVLSVSEQPRQDFLQGVLQRAAGILGSPRQGGLGRLCLSTQMLRESSQVALGPNWLRDGKVKISQPKRQLEVA